MRLFGSMQSQSNQEKNLDEFLQYEIYGLLTGEELTKKVTAAMRKLKLRNGAASVTHSVNQEEGSVTYSVRVTGEIGFFRRRAASGVLERRVSVSGFYPGTMKSIIEFMPHATWGHGLITQSSWKKHV